MITEKKSRAGLGRILFASCVFFLFLYLGLRFLGTVNFSYVVMWWVTLLLLGVALQPLAIVLFGRFHDGGWVFSKALGVAACGWLMWFLSSVKIFKFTRTACFFVSVFCLLLGAVLFYFLVMKKNRKYRFSEFYTVDRLTSMYCSEVLFFCLFVFWCYLKGINPAAYGTERFMDYGFMLSMFKSEYMPAKDMWYAGSTINYYYVGQYLATFITKLAGVPVTHGYNIAMMMIPAFAFTMSYSLGVNLVKTRLTDRSKENLTPKELEQARILGEIIDRDDEPFWRPVFGGTLAGLAVAFSSSLHYPIHKFIVPKVQRLLGVDNISNYWFPNATRYIGYFNDRDDKTIHEFPVYSFVIGDLHAHVINMIFVLTVLAVLFSWLLSRKARMDRIRLGETAGETIMEKDGKWNILPEVFHPAVVTCAFLVGMFYMTNSWDLPIYFVVSGAIILFSNLVVYRFSARAWILTAYQAALFLVVGIFVSLPFIVSFDSISTGIGFTSRHTWLREFLVLWGLPFACLIVFFVVTNREIRKTKKKDDDRLWIERFLSGMTVADFFVMTIAFCAAGLVLMPEVIYVRDIYQGAYERANTMFKLTYQAFIMFGLSMAYISIKYLSMPKSKFQKGFACAAVFLLLTAAGYFNECYTGWFSGKYSTLDASAFVANQNKDDAEMIKYINENIEGQPVILEMGGLSYTYYNRISVFTGCPTVIGWQTHEWLWRSSGDLECPEEVSQREKDVRTIYTSTDANEVMSLLNKYGVQYIYIGENERTYGYESLNSSDESAKKIGDAYYRKIDTNIDLLLSLGDIVKIIPETSKKKYATYLIKVRR